MQHATTLMGAGPGLGHKKGTARQRYLLVILHDKPKNSKLFFVGFGKTNLAKAPN